MSDQEEKGFLYILTKKKFPGWLYALVLGVSAIAVYLWFLSATK